MSEKNTEDLLINIKKRLDVLIALIIRKEIKENKSITMREIISFLSSLNLKYTEIADILGRSPSYISSEITLVKKGDKKNVKKKQNNRNIIENR